MKFESICVVGLGYIGLPTSAVFAASGVKVVGVDVRQSIVDTLNSGKIHIEEPGLEELVRQVVSEGRFKAQLTPEESDAFIIAVPTPTSEDNIPSLDYVYDAVRGIVPYLRAGNLVILESTSPPGTTMSLIHILEESGMSVGEDIFLAHSPERVLPGRILTELVENDRVIGGTTPEAAQAAASLYKTFVTGDIHLSDATTAEMAKLMENTFRDVNIALANELTEIGSRIGIDIHEAIELANHHPRVNILRPGPGVGGHCIAVDPWFIVDAAPELATLIRTARDVNNAQPAFVVDIVRQATVRVESPVIALLGMAYKPDVDDLRESPSIEVARILFDQGYDVRLHDAHAKVAVDGHSLESDLTTALDGADVILILTDHAEYAHLSPDSLEVVGMRNQIIVDTRNSIDETTWTTGGFSVYRLGARTSQHGCTEEDAQ